MYILLFLLCECAFIACIAYASKALQCWFFSLSEPRMAAYYWLKMRSFARFTGLYALWFNHYFIKIRNFYLSLLILSELLVILSPLICCFHLFDFAVVLMSLYIITLLIPFIIHLLFGRVKGTDNQRHETYNRFAKLHAMDRANITKQRKQAVGTVFYGRFIQNIDSINDDMDEQNIKRIIERNNFSNL